jgi:hypothetical protein
MLFSPAKPGEESADECHALSYDVRIRVFE